jgi:hypothetical protein
VEPSRNLQGSTSRAAIALHQGMVDLDGLSSRELSALLKAIAQRLANND